MPERKRSGGLDLTVLGAGERARVVALLGGRGAAGKLAAMGILPGVVIGKVSASLMRGPIVIERNAVRIALGFGLAQKVVVERVG